MKFYNNNHSSVSKIEGKFYPLQNEEHLRACKELTSTQRDILYHLKTLDPYGNRLLDISIVRVAEQLGLSRVTVSRALKVLDNLGWIELQLVFVRARVRVEQVAKVTNTIASDTLGDSSDTLGDSSDTLGDSSDTLGDSSDTLGDSSDTLVGLEPLSDIGFETSKNIKNIYTLKTLSTNENEKPKTEREIGKKDEEKFRKFATSKMEQLPKYPVLPRKWIDKHFDELRAEYEELERLREANEQQIRQTIEKPQGTGVDPLIAAGLESGEILEIDPVYKMLRDASGNWHHQHEWIEREKTMLAES